MNNNHHRDLLVAIISDIEYYKSYKFGLYEFIMANYGSLNSNTKLPAKKIIRLFKEITAMDQKIENLYRIMRNNGWAIEF